MTVQNKKSGLALLLALVFLCLNPATSTPLHAGDNEGRILVIGKVSSNPKKHYKVLKPMADYMVSQMRDLGYIDSEVLMAKDIKQLSRYMRQGKVDWVTESPFPGAILHRERY